MTTLGEKSFISQPVYLCGVTNASQSIFGTNQGFLCNLSLLVDTENLRKPSNSTKKSVFQLLMWMLGVEGKGQANCLNFVEGHRCICWSGQGGWLLLFLYLIEGVEVAISQHLRGNCVSRLLVRAKVEKIFLQIRYPQQFYCLRKEKNFFFDFTAPRLYFPTQLLLLWRHVQLALLVRVPVVMNQKSNFALDLKLSDALNHLARRRYFVPLRKSTASGNLSSQLTSCNKHSRVFARREFLKIAALTGDSNFN